MSAYDWAIVTGKVVVIAGVVYWYTRPDAPIPQDVDASGWVNLNDPTPGAKSPYNDPSLDSWVKVDLNNNNSYWPSTWPWSAPKEGSK